ncbi:MAG: hypothetical protein JXN61_14895 [Sedimentisphaerales bacterium]|nr:hypothetical protein [Sedimentisphaerales bacterium]
MDSDIKKLACDLIGKAYDHHKAHARFEETQRAWMVTAYFTLTGLVYGGVILRGLQGDSQTLSSLGVIALIVHLLVGICIMISVSKVSGEFRRHFSRGEGILKDVSELVEDEADLKKAFEHVWLETAAIKEDKTVRPWIALWSNASVHAYMFALLTSIDVHLLAVTVFKRTVTSGWGVCFAIVWFILATYQQRAYLTKIGATGT